MRKERYDPLRAYRNFIPVLGNFYMCKQLLLLHTGSLSGEDDGHQQSPHLSGPSRKPLWGPGGSGLDSQPWPPGVQTGEEPAACVWGAAQRACPALCCLRCGPAPPLRRGPILGCPLNCTVYRIPRLCLRGPGLSPLLSRVTPALLEMASASRSRTTGWV